MNNLNLTYNHSKPLLIVQSTGTLESMDLIQAIKRIPLYLNGHSKLEVLLNFSGDNVRISRNELNHISNLVRKAFLQDTTIRIANIVNQPIVTALAFVFKDLIQDNSRVEFEIFCTQFAALNWLNNYDS